MADDTNVSELLKQVNDNLKKANEDLLPKAENALKEAKNAGELSQKTKDEVDKALTEFNALSVAQNALQAELGEAVQLFARGKNGGVPESIKTPGQMVVDNSDRIKDIRANLEQGQRHRFSVQGALTSPDVPNGIIEPTRVPGIDRMPGRRLFIRDLISPGRTESNAIFWVQQTGFTNNAKAVKENTTKPYSEITFSSKITPVATIAHLFKASKQILDDFSQLASTIDAEMRFGLKQAEEDQILFGNGLDANLTGIIPQATEFAAPFNPEDKATNIDIIRLAMLQCALARLPATGTVMDMIEWCKIEMTKNSQGNYILANPMGLAGPTLWSLPVVDTDLPAFKGKFLTGSFAYGAQLFDREDANVVISTENADDFEKNMITLRCEERLALAVKRPEAFIYGDFAAALATVNA